LFTATDAGGDTTAPTIAMTTPAPGGTVTKNTSDPVVLTITEANTMNENSMIYGDTIQIIDVTVPGTPVLVAGTITYSAVAKTITFVPTAVWDAAGSHVYNIIVTTGLEDNAGNNLATTYLSDFESTA
jgi:hypothetical protein